MIDALARAEQLVRETPGAITLDQFRNPANPEIHRRTTAVEIWDDTGGAVDVVVSAPSAPAGPSPGSAKR